jgi:hypothetical protein
VIRTGRFGQGAQGERTYRYDLTRRWSGKPKSGGLDVWVMMNPSLADDTRDDQTVRNCTAFSQRDGAPGLRIINLIAYIETQPRLLLDAVLDDVDIVGPDNDKAWVRAFIGAKTRTGGRLIFAWGATPFILDREVREIFLHQRDAIEKMAAAHAIEPVCLGYTASSSPRHPSRLSHKTEFVSYGGH